MLEGLMQSESKNRLLVDEGVCLITQPAVSLKIGKSGAVFLQQLHYWLTSRGDVGVTVDGQRWVYNSYPSWVDNIQIFSESTIRRAVKKLEEMSVILTQNMNRKKSDHTKWYTINYDKLKELVPGLSALKTPLNKQIKKGEASLLKMNRPSGQNEQIINKETEITPENYPFSSEEKREEESTTVSQQVKEERDLKFKNSLVHDLLEIWNQTVGQGGIMIELTKKRSQYLIAAFKLKFHSSLEKWKQFCHQITTSDFLMGRVKSTFKASLDWILKFDIIQRIYEGDFGVKLEDTFQDFERKEERIRQEIGSSNESTVIKNFRRKMVQELGVSAYQAWFKDLKLSVDEKQGSFTFYAMTPFMRDYIDQHYLDKIRCLSSKSVDVLCEGICG